MNGHNHTLDHSHAHGHSHSHGHVLKSISRAFIIGIGLNLLFVITEVIAGLSINSLSLLSDAGHNFVDVISLLLSLLAIRLQRVLATEVFTYGYRKTTILVALFNAMILLASIGVITYEAIHRFFAPESLAGNYIAIIAGIGIIINSVTALLFFREKNNDLNIKSAYLHLFSDAVVSVGLVVGGIIIYYTSWYWIDPVLSLVIVAVILRSTWGLLKDSLRLSLDAVPREVDLDEARRITLAIPKIKDIHHIHIWSLSTTEIAMTAHLVLSANASKEEEHEIKKQLRHELEHLNITHVTIETEIEDVSCEEEECD
jgi:cobalt-zinc-cadmium efflux system protein